ncbi:sulfotransferase family protein [Kibdelosporangium aridum]|uniref:Sulfotransferase family protein n=1 Tax=Kibdelosporangium aridum TaxID=2030 RepID=A0A428Z4T7_KIBAR|nr:sulfotransferase family protein [Kibdelosporangium aridum]RSM81646.1 sulfotransferase family protein [Kibdelosporangium aridum]
MLKIVNAGLGRTGTTSLQVALDRLGFGPCYHMFDIINSPQRLAQWEKIVVEGQTPDWETVFDGFTSAVDGPPAIYYQEITKALPDVKVVLTIRDAERWYQSTYDTLYQFVLKSRENPPADGNAPPARLGRIVNTMVWNGLFGGRFEDKAHAIEVFHKRNQEIIDAVPADNLLVYDVKQGWAPLCAFLGVDVPAEEFPHANDTESMQQVIRQVSSGAGTN